MKQSIITLLLSLMSFLTIAQTDTSNSYFNKNFLNDNLKSGYSPEYIDSMNVVNAKESAAKQPFYHALSLGYTGKLLFPVGGYDYGVHPIYMNGGEVSVDLVEVISNLIKKDLDDFSKYSILFGFSMHFGNFGKIKNYYSTDSNSTSTSYTLGNMASLGSFYLEWLKRDKKFSPYVSIAYSLYQQDLSNIVKEKKGNNSTTSDNPIISQISRGFQVGIGCKYIKRFKTGNGYSISLQACYFTGTSIEVADIDEVTFNANHEPVYTLKTVKPNFVSLQVGTAFNF